MCGCETWLVTKREEPRLLIFEKKKSARLSQDHGPIVKN